MSQQQRLLRQLESARGISKRLLQDFQTPEDWTWQVHDKSNHALWFAGHMSVVDNFFISLLSPAEAKENPEFARLFGIGSKPVNDPAAYPPVSEVLAAMDERRQTLLAILHQLSDADFARPLPEGTPDFLSDFGSVFETAIWHEGVHSGQLTVVRRARGHQPLLGGNPPAGE